MLDVFPALRGFTLRLPHFVTEGVANELRGRRSPLVIGLSEWIHAGLRSSASHVHHGSGYWQSPGRRYHAVLLRPGHTVAAPELRPGRQQRVHSIMRQLVLASAILVIAMGLMMADRGLKLTGSGYDFNSLSSRWQQVSQQTITSSRATRQAALSEVHLHLVEFINDSCDARHPCTL